MVSALFQVFCHQDDWELDDDNPFVSFSVGIGGLAGLEKSLNDFICPRISPIQPQKQTLTFFCPFCTTGVYHNLHGRCLNLTQEQYVGTTAVREQWHTFFYSILLQNSVAVSQEDFVVFFSPRYSGVFQALCLLF